MAQPGDELEKKVGSYFVDIVRGGQLIEIQTRHFHAIRRKLKVLVKDHPVRLVYPVVTRKWIVKLAGDGETQLDRRKSPQRNSVYTVFRELVSFPALVSHPNLTIEVVFVHIDEVRVDDGRGSWRRKGWSIVDTRLLEVEGQVRLHTVGDWRALLPDDLEDPFTTRDLSEAIGERLRLAQSMAYCLYEMGAVERVGKRGNAYLYERLSG
ncbi:MAG: hypothetical protein JXJ17_13025 [Anaerolineae bacterium]|nr:hypothetical protein [Anaerolineae bacterium]